MSKSLLLELAVCPGTACSCLLTHTPHPLSRQLQPLSPSENAVFWSPFFALDFLLLSLPFFTSCGERCFHNKGVLKLTALIQSCASCHHDYECCHQDFRGRGQRWGGAGPQQSGCSEKRIQETESWYIWYVLPC